jgi:serine/threonine-protein kinase
MGHPSSPDSAGQEGARAMPAPTGAVGRVLGGRYRLLRRLGTGGMGSVWLCEHVALGRRYALKVLNADRATDPELVERFLQEARAASRITQENVVDVFDFGQDAGGEHYYVMEALAGRTLAQLIREEGPLPVGRALALLEQVCRALAAAHGRGVVHRDVKPDNVLVERLPDGSERAKLIDFGISHVPGGDRLTRDGEVIGTPEYMSPEQAAGEEVNALTDVYAVGVLGFELLTGCLPLVGPTAIATLVAHQTQDPVAPGLRRPGLGPEVDRLVLRALAKRPAERFPSMQAMAGEVLRVRLLLSLETAGKPEATRPGQSPTMPLPAVPAPVDWNSGPRRGVPPKVRAVRGGRALALGLIGSVLVMVVAVVAGVLLSRPPPAPTPPALPAPAAARPVLEEPPAMPRPVDEAPSAPRREARPAPRPRPPAEPPARDPYAPGDTLKTDPFR